VILPCVWALIAGNGTKMFPSMNTGIIQLKDPLHFLQLGSALRVGAKYKSFIDLECPLKKFQQDNYVQLYKRISRKLGIKINYQQKII
jgi:hypothetical protein